MANVNHYTQLTVNLSTHTYPIWIGSNCLLDESLLRQVVCSDRVLIVTNDIVAPHYLSTVRSAYADRQCDVVILNDGERYKNQASLYQIYDALIEHHHGRDSTLIALGGGVIGDITGFAAATYQRGLDWIQLPTTLLAHVDASVGGKTAINHPKAKNMIGCFYQPKAVIIDVTTLQSLPKRELRAGFAEIIKYALLSNGSLLQALQVALQQGIYTLSGAQFTDLIKASCEIKSAYIEADERDKGVRMLLNLGHTVAHALESVTQYKRWLHGEAVAIGLYCAALLSYQRGHLNKQALNTVDTLLMDAGLPRRIPASIDLESLYACMRHDKKIKANQLRFVLMRSIGDAYLEHHVSDNCLRRALISAVEGD